MSMSRTFRTGTLALTLLAFSQGLYADPGPLVQIRLVDAHDEPEYYCLDVSGWGDHLKLDDPLQAHTCKGPDGADQMFAVGEERIHVLETDRCLEVAGTGKPLPGAAIIARTCSDNLMQSLTISEGGQIKVTGTDLCVSVGADSAPASGPSHMWRVLSVQQCSAVESRFNTWQIGV